MSLTKFLSSKRKDTNKIEVPVKGAEKRKLLDKHDFSLLNIRRITKVYQPNIYALYQLKKMEYKLLKKSLKTMELYHDTESSLIPSILQTNLDWRKVKRFRYGRGVSFSTSVDYAYKYSNYVSDQRALIIAEVLIGDVVVCKPHYLRRRETVEDTAQSKDGNVYVKFCDNEFYPKYIVYYDSVNDSTDEDEYYNDNDDDYDDNEDDYYDYPYKKSAYNMRSLYNALY